jgi:hypothetical protein
MSTTTMMLVLFLLSVASAFTIPTRNIALQSSNQVSKQLYSAQSDTVQGDPQAGEDDDGEMHPSNPGRTTSQFLSGLWHLIARGNTLVRGVSSIVLRGGACMRANLLGLVLIDYLSFS